MRTIFGSLLCLVLLAGCASNAAHENAEDLNYSKAASVDIKWRLSLGEGPNNSYARFEPAVADDTIYAADLDGSVQALALKMLNSNGAPNSTSLLVRVLLWLLSKC